MDQAGCSRSGETGAPSHSVVRMQALLYHLKIIDLRTGTCREIDAVGALPVPALCGYGIGAQQKAWFIGSRWNGVGAKVGQGTPFPYY